MTPERWLQIEELFHRADECPPELRTALLDEACNADADLRREVEVLLASEKSASQRIQAALDSGLGAMTFPLVGETVSHYRILAGLGGGGMGLVYRAEDIKLGRQVALKFLPEDSAKDPAALGRFEHEARAASALNHPNICTIYAVEEHEGQPFIAMELLEGQTLRELVSSAELPGVETPTRKGPLPLETVLGTAIQIAEGLEVAHKKGIVHRDIKPANIFVTIQGQVKLLDFGLAKLQESETPARPMPDPTKQQVKPESNLNLTLTRTGTAIGTAGYMSPEQVRGEKLDARTDLFSFGLVLYEMAAGQRAFCGEAVSILRAAILDRAPTSFRELKLEVPPELEEIINKALEKDRGHRYQHASDMRADLQRLKRDTEAARLAAISPPSVSAMLPRAFDSIAVLPLINASGDPEIEYLSDGISESIINLLAQLPNLRVIPRTSAFRYKGYEADLKSVASDLKVRTVLTGKMNQRGEKLAVQTELVDVVNDAQLWGGQFNRNLDDIFEVQEELARQISENLRVRLTPEDEKCLAKRPTQNREAYQLLLKAEYHLNKMIPEGFQRGMTYARQAIEADPGYAEAYAVVSAIYVMLGFFNVAPAEAFPKAKAAALKALEIDDSLAEAHAALARVRLLYEWDWSGAEDALKRAMEQKPSHALAHATWGDWLFIMGRHEEAMAETQLALELDPLSAIINFNLGRKLFCRGDDERALELLNKARELDPDFMLTYVLLALAYARKAMYAESLAAYEKVASLLGGNPFSRALHSLILAMVGKTEEAKQVLTELKRHPKPDCFSLLAETCSVLGEKNEAFELLESAYQAHVPQLIYLGVRPAFDNIRSDPRYADLLCRMGLPLVPMQSHSVESVTIEEIESKQRGAAVASVLNSRRRPWHWTFVAAVVVAVLAAVAIGTFLYTGKAHALSERDTIVLADFTNTTGDTVFDGTLRQGLAVQLEQSPFLSLISDDRIQQTLRLMSQAPDARLSPETAREVCQRTSSAAVLEGSITQIGTRYLLTLKAVDCATGDSLASAEAQAADKNHVLDALGEIASSMRNKLGESLGTVRKFDTPLEQATTPSLEALKALSSGVRIVGTAGVPAAIPFLQRATELDPNFAFAYAYLGLSTTLIGEPSIGVGYTRKAYELRERTSEPEKYLISALYNMEVTGNMETAGQACQLWIQAYPRSEVPHDYLSGVIYPVIGQQEKAVEQSREALRLNPDDAVSYALLMFHFTALNRLDQAKASYEQALKRKLDHPFIHIALNGIAFMQNDTAGIAQQIAWAAGKPGIEDNLLALQADTVAYSGHLREAREFSRRAADSAERAGQKETSASYSAVSGLREALFGNTVEARHNATLAMERSTGRDVQYGSALALAYAGDHRRARMLTNDLATRFPEDTSVLFNYLPTLRAKLALGPGNALAAIENLRAASPYELGQTTASTYDWTALYPVYVRGEAYLAAHQANEAAAEFQKILDHLGVLLNEPIGALAYLQIGRAYAMQGDTAKAKGAYHDFLTLWKDADPDVPVLRQAKAEYAKLH